MRLPAVVDRFLRVKAGLGVRMRVVGAEVGDIV